MPRPFEEGPRPEPEPEPKAEPGPNPDARPLPCPECQSTKGYSRMGNFRVQCKNCNSLIKNEEVDMQLPTEENS